MPTIQYDEIKWYGVPEGGAWIADSCPGGCTHRGNPYTLSCYAAQPIALDAAPEALRATRSQPLTADNFTYRRSGWGARRRMAWLLPYARVEPSSRSRAPRGLKTRSRATPSNSSTWCGFEIFRFAPEGCMAYVRSMRIFKPGGISWTIRSFISIISGRGRFVHPDEDQYLDLLREQARRSVAHITAQPNSRLVSVEEQGPIRAAKSRFESIPVFSEREVTEWQRLT